MLKNGERLSPNSVARWFINRIDREAGDAITHLKVQKLLYYADAWYLANFKAPLFDENFEAWAHGPVCREVYDEFRSWSWNSIPEQESLELNEKILPFLEAVFEEYGSYSAKALEKLTHAEEPWIAARGDLPPEGSSDTPIDKKLMQDYYSKRFAKK